MASDALPAPADVPAAPSALAAEPSSEHASRPVKRSWRRKYRKMRIRFDDAMSESNRLLAAEWRAMGTVRRLAQDVYGLLDVLLDCNDQSRAIARLRFNLDAHADAGQQDALQQLTDLEARVPHTTRADLSGHPVDGLELGEHTPGYVTTAHEDEYLSALDQLLAEPGFDQAIHEGRPLRLASAQSPLSDKDLTVRNPDSVYNWLRKHQPQVFLQDKDATHPESVSEKSAAKGSAGSRKVKRESAVGSGTPGPRENEDEDSTFAPETKGRRKTGGDDDTAYRPKGGSSRPVKRKREDGDTPSGKSKKKSRPSAHTSVIGTLGA